MYTGGDPLNPELNPVDRAEGTQALEQGQEEWKERARQIEEMFRENFLSALRAFFPEINQRILEQYFQPELDALTKPFPDGWATMSESDRKSSSSGGLPELYKARAFAHARNPEDAGVGEANRFAMAEYRERVLGENGVQDAAYALQVLRELEARMLTGGVGQVLVAARQKWNGTTWADYSRNTPNRGVSPVLRSALGSDGSLPLDWADGVNSYRREGTGIPGVAIFSVDHAGGKGDTPFQQVTLQIEPPNPEGDPASP